ncbi:Flp family type IVb pilin [Magnetospirillum sp. 64-120]|uniref:Flp family type IVb pilin n=1 Tax=Magnetospirillum sp. 64-120 TaxID=1895778 RepID=UPI0025B8C5DF|nr:Flp family type IVb pilin [Magnetospirillum sp. 64-120]
MITNIRTLLSKTCRDERGATAIEYGLIAALVAIVIIGGLQALSGGLNTLFNTVATTLGG